MDKSVNISLKVEKELHYDLVVVGGGMSGTSAAVSAARSGVKTLLIDENSFLGGALTSMGVGPMMTFFAGEKQVIKGIGQEIIDRLVSKGFSPGHVRDATNYVSYNTPFDAEGLKLILDEMVSESNCDCLFNTKLIGVENIDKKLNSIVIHNKDGLTKITSKIFIDATGDAELAKISEVPYSIGRGNDSVTQPMTMNIKVSNVDVTELKDYILNNLDRFPRAARDLKSFKTAKTMAVIGFYDEMQAARETGEVTSPRKDLLFFETNTSGEFIINSTRIIHVNGTDAADLSKAEVIGRKQSQEIINFFRKSVPGFQNLLLEYTGPRVGVRQTRQIIGDYTLTRKDIINNTRFIDTIAHSGYPIDVHTPDGIDISKIKDAKIKEAEINKTFSREDFEHYYQIPYRVMTIPGYKNLLVTGRCVSAEFDAQGAIRTTPTMTALGQAAGLAANLALNTGDVHSVNISELQDRIVQTGGFLDTKVQ
ncbi:FAD-dependent oxidoreductase [Enterococcus songbeiensis]|uniref:FAD-dependent oxidoreductase n=1 Tax=Enterococcus songbeiensis TaxID=2559927 RepID=UPI0010F6C588|nr:FAD-dependent oxidoreductase [Enterococcus songbeiensis]